MYCRRMGVIVDVLIFVNIHVDLFQSPYANIELSDSPTLLGTRVLNIYTKYIM